MSVVKAFEGEYAFLSNFAAGVVDVDVMGDRMRFQSAEHAFQAMKAWAVEDDNTARKYAFGLTKTPTPGEAKAVGRSIKIDVHRWDEIKDACMRSVVFSKFYHNLGYRSRLLETDTMMLVEGNTHGDVYWGRCEGKGLNRLGAILMEVRGYWHFADRIDLTPMSETQAHILMGW